MGDWEFPPRIMPGAFDFTSKTVPLVVYDSDGNRKVIGEAVLTPDGDHLKIEGHVKDESIAQLISGKEELAGLSIFNAPAKPKGVSDAGGQAQS